MKNFSKILAFALALTLVFGVVAMQAFAESNAPFIIVGNVSMFDGDYLANGATAVSAEAPAEGGYAYYKDGVLTLNNYAYEGEGFVYFTYEDPDIPTFSYYYTSIIYSEVFFSLKLEGESSIVNTAAEGDGITPNGGLLVMGDGTLCIDAEYGIYAEVDNANEEDAKITVEEGNLFITNAYNAISLSSYNGSALVKLNGGSITCENSSYGISAYCYADLGNATIEINDGETALTVIEEALVAIAHNGGGEEVIAINGGHVTASTGKSSFYSGVTNINGGVVKAEVTNEAEDIVINSEIVFGENVVITDGSPDGKFISTHFTYFKGDVNGDGEIDAFDYLLLKGIYFETVNYSFEDFVRADADFDGEITPFDYLIVKNVYFEGGEPVLLPEASMPTPPPTPELDPNSAYAKLYNYILANGTVDSENEGFYTVSSEPATNDETGNVFITMMGTYSDSTDVIELGGAMISPDGTEMLIISLQITQNTTEYGVTSLYVVNEEAAAMTTGTVVAGGCEGGRIDILDFDGSVSETTQVTLETLEPANEELLYASLASIEAMLIDTDISLADFGFDCFAQPL